MSSVLLYLAIVVMWLCVLVPMWLRRDRSNLAELEEFYAAEVTGPVPVLSVATPAEPHEVAEPVETDYAPLSDDTISELNRQSMDLRRLKGRRRAIIVARRRRMLFFSILLVLASVVTAAVQVIPWWGVAPAGGAHDGLPHRAAHGRTGGQGAQAARRGGSRGPSAQAEGAAAGGGAGGRAGGGGDPGVQAAGRPCSTSTPTHLGARWGTERDSGARTPGSLLI
ncbi:hypothetical protein [Nonomuraea dietziae]|uniref:hypothetical protein n=1 Tax=Nonomuraea dietziae TaxID=65515 RepID=UPI0031D64E90